MERISDGKLGSTINSTNELYLDGSHNGDAASNLNETINKLQKKVMYHFRNDQYKRSNSY